MVVKRVLNQLDEQLRYVRVLHAQVDQIDERVAGYRAALRDTVTDILALEQQNVTRKTNITQQVTAKVQSLGELMISMNWND